MVICAPTTLLEEDITEKLWGGWENGKHFGVANLCDTKTIAVLCKVH